MKTTMKSAAVIFFLALVTYHGNLYAKEGKLKSSVMESIAEPALNVASWMVNERLWNVSEIPAGNMEFEPALELENWMAEEYYFEPSNFIDESLTVENWMTDEKVWNQGITKHEEVLKDKLLAVEPWMINENNWNITR